MYRKRARAAHVLHPTDSASAAAPVAAGQGNQATAAGPTPPGNVSGAGYNPQPPLVSATPQMQFFNPMTYQNGFAGGPSGNDPHQFPGAQLQSQQVGVAEGVTNAGPPPQGFNYGGEQLNEQQSINQQGSYDYQGNWQGQQQVQTNQQPIQNINQELVANKQVANAGTDQQGWQQPVPDSQQAWQQQANAAVQQQPEPAAVQQQDNQAYAEQQQANDVANQQSQQNGEVNPEQQQLELILDPSGQWCWDYYAQQWVPYSAEQQPGNNQPEEQREGGNAQIDLMESTPSEAISNAQGMVYQQEGVGDVADNMLGSNGQQQLQELSAQPPANNLQDLVNGIENLEIGQDASDLSMPKSMAGDFVPVAEHFQPPTEHALPPPEHVPPPSEHIPPPSEHIPPPSEHIPSPSENIPPPSEHVPPPSEHAQPSTEHAQPFTEQRHGFMHQQSHESDYSRSHQEHYPPPQQYYQPSNQQVPRQPSVESQPFNSETASVDAASNDNNSAQEDAYHGQAAALVGPPDLVDMRQYNQPEIVNDVNNYAAPSIDNKAAPPPPDMFASLPISSYTYSGNSVGAGGLLHPPPAGMDPNRNSNDYAEGIEAHASNVNHPPQMELQLQSVAPDLTAQSIIQQSMANSNEQSNNPGNGSASGSPMYGSGGATGGALAHDQHHDFYKDQIESAMPDLTSGQRSSWDANSNRVNHPPRRASQDKAPDILRTEPLVVPSTDRNLYMETGELREEDVHRVAHEIPGSLQPSLLQPVLLPTVSSAVNKSAQSNLPPMVGGNEPPMLGSVASESPSLVRMVVGESVAAPPPSIPPPAMMSIPPTNQRLVEGGSNGSDGAGVQIVPPLPAREIEGEVGSNEPRANMYPDTIDRTIEGEDESSIVPLAPPPVQTREVEGEPQPLPPPPSSTSRLPPPPNAGIRMAPMRGYPGAQSGNQSTPLHDQDYGALSSALSSTPLDSSPIHQVSGGMPHQINSNASLSPNTEVRSAAAGSDKRDETVMGGPPPPVKAPPLPTPGRAVAGQEATGIQPQPGYPPATRRRGDDYKKSTYDSDDDNVPESESERNDVQKRRIQPRRNLSPKGNRATGRPVRGYDRLNRSSTDRDDDSDRKHDFSRDDDDYYNGSKTLRNHDRRSNRRDYDRRHNVDDRDDDRRSNYGGREDDRRSQYGRDDDRRSLHGRDRADDDRRSYQGGGGRRREQGGRYRDLREESYYRRGRNDSELDRESFYGDDHPNRPSSRAGSVSHYDATMNDSMFSRVGGGGGGGMAGGMAFYPQLLQQQYQYQIQYQIQTAVQEMEKSLANPDHVKTYKAYWDTYGKQPQLMEKLRLENPILHHLLIHFQRNFLHLIEDKKTAGVTIAAKEDVTSGDKVLGAGHGDPEDQEVEEFARKFHQLSPSHRPESREAGLESTIAGPQDSVLEHTSSASIQPARLTPLMFSRPHVCARVSASGLLIKVDAHSPREGQSATVELHSVASLLQHTQEYRELTIFPGPLKPKETHRNDVIKFCERKMADARDRRMVDRDSYELIWRMLILLLRQKGQVEGSDLADLLITDKKNRMDTSMEPLSADRSRGGSSYRGQIDAEETASMSSISEEPGERTDRTMSSKTFINSGASQEEYVAKFRSYLLHGNKTEGLEFAMNAGLWGHALFLASKMDQRTYATVMTRFANGLAVNDPLQTLYQLMSARIPAAMKNFADQRLGDWRPHLAMILSNPYPGSDINRRSMKTLGDTLLSKGQIYAAQFCYIVSGMEFGNYSNKTSKLVLLLSMPGEKSVDEFASNEAIQCTEIYEFVQKLGSPEFEMPTLQPYKFLHAVRLVECGLTNQAQAYCREIAEYVINNPNNIVRDFLPEFLQQLETLSDRLKYQDPQYTTSSGELSEIPDPEWMGKLREAVHNITYADMYASQAADTAAADTNSSSEPQSGYYDQSQYQASAEYTDVHQEQQAPATQEATQQQDYDQVASYQADDHSAANNNEYGVTDPAAGVDQTGQTYGYHQSNGWDNGNMQAIPEQQPQVAAYGENGTYHEPASNEQHQPPPTMFNPESYNAGNQNFQQDVLNPGDEMNLQPTTNSVMTPMFNPADIPSYANNMPISDISNPGSRKTSLTEPQFRKNSLPSNDIVQDSNANNEIQSTKASPTKAKTNEKSSKPAQPVKKSSWLPGFIGKILNPPNQVHLPDDSNKTIYYDDKLGRWVNTEADEDASAPAAPPPMDPAFMNKSKDSSALAPPGASSLSAPNSVPSSPSEVSPSGTSSFRVAKRRGRAAYVDVNKQSGLVKPMAGAAGMPPMMMAAPSDQAQPTSLPPMMFNPGAVEPTSNGTALDEGGPSSLQPDAGGYGGGYEQEGEAEQPAPTGFPMMFNPSSMGSVTAPPTF